MAEKNGKGINPSGKASFSYKMAARSLQGGSRIKVHSGWARSTKERKSDSDQHLPEEPQHLCFETRPEEAQSAIGLDGVVGWRGWGWTGVDWDGFGRWGVMEVDGGRWGDFGGMKHQSATAAEGPLRKPNRQTSKHNYRTTQPACQGSLGFHSGLVWDWFRVWFGLVKAWFRVGFGFVTAWVRVG